MKIECNPNCTCMGCSLINEVNNITNLQQLLKCRDRYKEVRKSLRGPRMDKVGWVIESKLAKIKV